MEYQELEDVYEFHRNMRTTPWMKLFPHWWDERDALTNAIGDEVERIKAQSIFNLLNAGIKPPVLLWQESIIHKEYNAHFNATALPKQVTVQAPLYKTWGKITLTNNTKKDIDGLILKLDNNHGYAINQLIAQEDILVIDLTNNKVLLNKKKIEPQKIGNGMPYFVTQQNNKIYNEDTPLHNEVIRLEISTNDEEIIECDIDIDIQLDNVVFTNEQNIEITGLEAVPIERVELYAKYDFDFNSQYNGWQKVYQKIYDENTNVVYDMITTQIYTKEFYVDVYFKTIQYPYQVGFPCDKDATSKSPYHVNTKLDKWGDQLGLTRQLYKIDIPEDEYYRTFPEYYPFNIEQDYWYFKRLTSEYARNETPINDVDIKDTDGNNVIRLYSINPFVEDFAVHAKSKYPVDKEFINNNSFKPIVVSQQTSENIGVQTPFSNIINLLSDDNTATSITLNNYTDNNDVIYKRKKDYEKSVKYIGSATHQSNELLTYFDLSDLPQNINIEDIEVIVEAESTDNKKNKYSTENTGLLIPNYTNTEQFFIPLITEDNYQLKKQLINYSNNDIQTYLNDIKITDENIVQRFTIGKFQGKIGDFVKIPFTLLENDEQVNDITDIWLYYDGNIRQASYHEDEQCIYAYVPNLSVMTNITIVCKSITHKPFTYNININKVNQYANDGATVEYQYISGPIVNGANENISDYIEWHTDNIRNLIQKQGIYFRNVIKNMDTQSSTSIYLYNITLKVTYSPKKSRFQLKTYINKKSDFPNIGVLNVEIKNVGEKNLYNHIDIITPPNIKLEYNHIPVDLKIGESLTKEINIVASYPIDDGFYDIVTVCEDVIKKDSIEVFSDGLIQTGVQIIPHHGHYNDEITLKANVTAIDGSIINDTSSQVQFYINGFAVGNKVQVNNGQAEVTILPNQYYFTGTGSLPLEAKFLGTTKYASSNKKTTIFISKDDTRITLIANSQAPYKGAFEVKAKVEYYNGQKYIPVDAGSVDFYINDEILSSNSILSNGIFIASINKIENPPDKYTLWGRYSGTESYSAAETSQDFEIIGGKTKISVFDIKTRPRTNITLKAKVLDSNNRNIINGYVDFFIKNSNNEYVNFGINNLDNIIKNVEVNNGIAITENIFLNIDLDSDLNVDRYVIEAKYHNTLDTSEDDLYESSSGVGYIYVSKEDVTLQYQPIFYGTQYEPLGFYIKVINSKTGENVSSGTISITLQNENITIEENVDENGIARLIYKPLDFSAKDWAELEKFSFTVDNDDLWRHYNGDEFKANFDFFYNENDGTLHFIQGKKNQNNDEISFRYNANTGKYDVIDNSSNQSLSDYDNEHLYITNGHLYARTTKDALRQYFIGSQDLKIKYHSDGQYRNKTEYLENGLQINQSDVDLDIHTYDLKYTDNDVITCYVTRYSSSDNITTTTNINRGSVQFIIDNEVLDTVDVFNGKAILDNKLLTNINAGNHLMCVRYIDSASYTSSNYSYSFLNLTKLEPTIDILVDQEIANEKSNIVVTLSSIDNLNIPLNGLIYLYLDDTLIGTQYLNGNEMLPGIVDEYNLEQLKRELALYSESEKNIYVPGVIFSAIMPDDINIAEKHKFMAIYEGNGYLMPKTQEYNILQKPVEINIDVKNDIYVAQGQPCFLDINVSYNNNIINEGQISLEYGNEIITSNNVLDNTTRLSWTPSSTNLLTDYVIKYSGSSIYREKSIPININVIEPLLEITIPNEHQETIEEALMCLRPKGTIYINEDIILDKSIEINKDCSIIGNNEVAIIKDVKELPIDFNILQTVSNDERNSMYKINNLSIKSINATDFAYYDNQIYIKTAYENIPIYLSDNGSFYCERPLTVEKILSNLNFSILEDVDVHIDNIVFKSNDDNAISNFIIYNKGKCLITYSIIESTTKLYNKGTLTAHRNLIYGLCQGEADLDNNWWGSNTPPYQVNNHIIINVDTPNTPAVISEEVDVVGEMIGANGQNYTIPQVKYKFTSDNGFFSIDTGKTTNQKAYTKFLDGTSEGNIYFTVDNETVSCPVYGYERKTEVIIDDIEEVLINHQIPITAKVQSCADKYYEFDENNNIIKNTHAIDEGYIDFYIDDKQVGHQTVQNGEAQIQIFFKDVIYDTNKEYNLIAIYHAGDNYFNSQNNINIKVISEDNVCFVSTQGSDNNLGTYSMPVATISKAMALNKDTIFLLQGEYQGEGITVTHNVTIKKYNGNVIFKNNSGNNLFNIQKNRMLHISGIDFISNKNNIIFNNSGSLSVDKCIFYNNNGTIFKNNLTSSAFNVSLCAIVNNNNIENNINPNKYTYCWFGSNTPAYNFNDYIVMTTKQSKDTIYIGTLAHVTGELKHYMHDNVMYQLDKPLPLRIANFATDIGEAKPIQDYTYNNSSTSLINTLKSDNTSQYIISLDNNIFYDKEEINLKFYAKDVYGNLSNVSREKIQLTIDSENISDNVILKNGVGSYSISSLPIGEYPLYCTYIKNGNIYNLSTSFTIKPLDVILENIKIDNNSHLYYTNIQGIVKDNFGRPINDEILNIKIDNNKIDTLLVSNGIINKTINYSLLSPGFHTLTIDNDKIKTEYDIVRYDIPLNVKAQKTHIDFDYNNIEKDINNNLIVEIYDEEGKEVQTGSITIELDDNTYRENIEINNGIAIIENFSISESGQHSIVIYYHDLNGFYQNSVYVNSHFGVGIYNVIFSLSNTDIITADIGKDLDFNLNIQDKGNQNVNTGYVNLYIDDSLFVHGLVPHNGQINVSASLPDNISAGLHTFTIEYLGNNIYLDTYLDTYLNIGKIKTDIGINTVSGNPGQKSTINYTINSIYGNVNTGILTALIVDENKEEQIIGKSVVTDSIVNQITINTPFLPAGNNYEIYFRYHDDNDNYSDDEKSIKMIIEKNYVIMEPQKTWYYPKKDFNFVIDIRNQENNIIDEGLIDLYINNVKEHEDIPVVNGQAVIPLCFNKATKYDFNIIYKEDDYYLQTAYDLSFNVDTITINDISFANNLSSLPNQMFSTELIFDTLDNYNVTDGIIDILFDNNKIASYYIAENNKYIDFNIGEEPKGEHILTLQYHDSTLFEPFEKDYTFNIEAKTVDLRINIDNNYESQDIDAISSDTILIQTSFIKENTWQLMSGIVKYYIGIPRYRMNNDGETYIESYYDRFIGLEEFNNESSLTHEYILTNDLLEYAINNLETHYKIKAHFIGNDEYEETIENVNLTIHKQNTRIILPSDIRLEYQSEMDIDINIVNSNNQNLIGKEDIDIYLDDVLIATCTTIDGIGNFKYRLKNDYTVGDYTLHAVFNGSAVNNESESESILHIEAFTPTLKTNNIDMYVGGTNVLDNIIYDKNGIIITTGTLKYTWDNEELILTPGVPKDVKFSSSIRDDWILNVEYISDDLTKYKNFNKTITMSIKKNPIELSLFAPEKIYRGVPFDITIHAEAPTTSLPIHLTFNRENEIYTMLDGTLTTSITYPITLEDNSIIQEYITTEGNDIFESAQVLLKLHTKNKETITIDTSLPESANNVHTIQQAINLVNNNGTIEINSSLNNQTINLNKNLTIKGNAELTNCSIINEDNKLTIDGLTFKNGQTCINNGGNLKVTNCSFINNQDTAIVTQGNTKISNCLFEGNTAQKGACIQAGNKTTSITNCKFNGNHASLYGGCIYSDKINDIEILNNEFSNNNKANIGGSSIYAYGNVTISSNTFFNNEGANEIYLLRGMTTLDNNLFDSKITPLYILDNTEVDADLNYWGYNDFNDIVNIVPDILINSYLIADYELIHKDDGDYVIVYINKYISRLEAEITTINAIKKAFTVNEQYNINEEIPISDASVINIGQDTFNPYSQYKIDISANKPII